MLLSVPETAHYLGLSEKTIRNWLSLGTCPWPTVRLGARRLVRRVDLEKYVRDLVPEQTGHAGLKTKFIDSPAEKGGEGVRENHKARLNLVRLVLHSEPGKVSCSGPPYLANE